MLLTLLQSILLIVNAIAILNEKRFLKKCIDYFLYYVRWIRYHFSTTRRCQLNCIFQKSSHYDDIHTKIDRKICSHTAESDGDHALGTRMTLKYQHKVIQQVFQIMIFENSLFQFNPLTFYHLKFVYLFQFFLTLTKVNFFVKKSQDIITLPFKTQQHSKQIIKFLYNMSNQGSRVTSPLKSNLQTYQHSYVTIDPSTSNAYSNSYSSYSIPNKAVYTGPSVNTYHQSRLTTNQVSHITGSRVRQGSVVKGQSRIQYVPYEKKVVDYQTRTYKQMIPKTRKVVDYQQKKIIQTVPRQVVKQDYIAVQKITQYYKQIVPEKKVQIVPVERKVKRVEYVPVQKQIVHYPQNQDFRTVRGQSRAVLQSQGVLVRPDAQYKPIQSDLLYKFTNNTQNPHTPVGYVDLGSRRYLSTAPTIVNPNLGYSNVQVVGGLNSYSTYSTSNIGQPIAFQQSQVYTPIVNQQPTYIHRVNQQNFNNVISGNKYEYRYGNVGSLSPRSNY